MKNIESILETIQLNATLKGDPNYSRAEEIEIQSLVTKWGEDNGKNKQSRQSLRRQARIKGSEWLKTFIK